MNETGNQLDAALNLLDRQVVDVDGLMVGKVDDVEITERDDGSLAVSALLTGPGALGPRLDGPVGRFVTGFWRTVANDPRKPGRIDIADVQRISSDIRLSVTRAAVHVDGFELWVRRQVISHIPGAGHDPNR